MRGCHLLLVAAAVLTSLSQPMAREPQARTQGSAARPEQGSTGTATLPAGNVEHGRYIVEHVAMCVECHSGRDHRGNIIEAEKYLGAPIPFAPPWTNDWAMRAPRNRGLPGYSDAQALRLLTQGAIGRDGVQLRAPMPRFRMTPQDAADVIAFMRSM